MAPRVWMVGVDGSERGVFDSVLAWDVFWYLGASVRTMRGGGG